MPVSIEIFTITGKVMMYRYAESEVVVVAARFTSGGGGSIRDRDPKFWVKGEGGLTVSVVGRVGLSTYDTKRCTFVPGLAAKSRHV